MGYKKISGIYCITNKLNEKKYIGESTNIKRRWNEHKNRSIKPYKPDQFRKELYQDMRKYGIDNFDFKIIEECSAEDLKEREIYWINQLNTYENGYNNSYGGHLPCKTYEHHLTDHGMAVLTIGEVKMCREAYKNGFSSREIFEKYNFIEKITYSGFLRMWHGKTWKEIMPEVFKNNPHPRQKVTQELVKNIRDKVNKENNKSLNSIYKENYKQNIGWATFYGIATNKTYI